MKHVSLGEPGRTHFLVGAPGDEVMEALAGFAAEQEIRSARVWGIGGLSDARLGFYDEATKEYAEHRIDQPTELLGLHGNLTRYQGRPRVHLHAVLGLEDLSAKGGHLLEAHVHPTLELFIAEARVELVREIDEAVGIPVVRP